MAGRRPSPDRHDAGGLGDFGALFVGGLGPAAAGGHPRDRHHSRDRARRQTTTRTIAEVGRAASKLDPQSVLLIEPQFLNDADVAAYHLPAETLHWSHAGWEGGDDAQGPAPISSFAALDAILARLADRVPVPVPQDRRRRRSFRRRPARATLRRRRPRRRRSDKSGNSCTLSWWPTRPPMSTSVRSGRPATDSQRSTAPPARALIAGNTA